MDHSRIVSIQNLEAIYSNQINERNLAWKQTFQLNAQIGTTFHGAASHYDRWRVAGVGMEWVVDSYYTNDGI